MHISCLINIYAFRSDQVININSLNIEKHKQFQLPVNI